MPHTSAPTSRHRTTRGVFNADYLVMTSQQGAKEKKGKRSGLCGKQTKTDQNKHPSPCFGRIHWWEGSTRVLMPLYNRAGGKLLLTAITFPVERNNINCWWEVAASPVSQLQWLQHIPAEGCGSVIAKTAEELLHRLIQGGPVKNVQPSYYLGRSKWGLSLTNCLCCIFRVWDHDVLYHFSILPLTSCLFCSHLLHSLRRHTHGKLITELLHISPIVTFPVAFPFFLSYMSLLVLAVFSSLLP